MRLPDFVLLVPPLTAESWAERPDRSAPEIVLAMAGLAEEALVHQKQGTGGGRFGDRDGDNRNVRNPDGNRGNRRVLTNDDVQAKVPRTDVPAQPQQPVVEADRKPDHRPDHQPAIGEQPPSGGAGGSRENESGRFGGNREPRGPVTRSNDTPAQPERQHTPPPQSYSPPNRQPERQYTPPLQQQPAPPVRQQAPAPPPPPTVHQSAPPAAAPAQAPAQHQSSPPPPSRSQSDDGARGRPK